MSEKAAVVITGLQQEAQLLRRARVQESSRAWEDRLRVLCAGPGPQAAERAFQAAAAACRAEGKAVGLLLSVGFAGALIPALDPGEIVVPENIVSADGGRYPAAPLTAWPRGLERLSVARLAGVAAPLLAPQAKTDLHLRTGAAAADMESGALAAAAAAAGIPFAAARVISDAQAAPLPGWLLGSVDDAGRLDAGRLGVALLTHPGDWPAFARLALSGSRARAALGRLGAALFEIALPFLV